MQQFKVGDKVQSTAYWAPEYKYAIVTEVEGEVVWADWYERNGEVHTHISFHADTLYLLEPSMKKKGLCMFLDKVESKYGRPVTKEYSK